MDKTLAELLDDGWQLLQQNALPAARAAHERAEAWMGDGAEPATDRLRAEVWALGGAIYAASGECDRALVEYARAAEGDPECARYHLLAADLLLCDQDDPEAAIAACDRALGLTIDEAELVDAVLCKADALIRLAEITNPGPTSRNRTKREVRALLAELDACSIRHPEPLCIAGALHLTVGDLAAARRAICRAVDLDPDRAESHYRLGLVHEASGDRDGMVSAWLRARELDLAAERPPWSMSTDDFAEVAERAMQELPEDALAHLANVPVVIDDAPTEELVKSGTDPRLLGLFSGVPLPHKSHIVDGRVPAIDTIYLYQRNLERACTSRQQLKDEIRITLLHETAHFFGLEDDDLGLIGLD